MTTLAETLAALEKATPGAWEVLGDNQGHPCGLEWTIEAPELADEDYTGWIAGEHGGDGIATTGNPGSRYDAEAIVAAVNFLRSPEFAELQRDAEQWRQFLAGVGAEQVMAATQKFGDTLGVLRDAKRYQHARHHALSELLQAYPTTDTSDVGLDYAIDQAIARAGAAGGGGS